MEGHFTRALCFHKTLTTIKTIKVLWNMKKRGDPGATDIKR